LCGTQAGCGEFMLYGVRNLYEAPLDEVDKCEARCRFRRLADEAWHAMTGGDPGGEFSVHYARGVRAGYVGYLRAGGTGEPPAAPPWIYRSSRFETPEGRQAIEDWFAGFRQGTQAARASGYRELVTLPLALPPKPRDGRMGTAVGVPQSTD